MVRRPPASSGFCGVWEAPAAPTTVVRRVAGLPPTLAMPMEALWFGSSGQIQRAEYGAAVAGVAGGLAFGRALVTTPRPVVARTRIATRPRVVRARPGGTWGPRGAARRDAPELSGCAAGTAGAAGTTGTTGARAARGARVTRPRRGRAWPGRLGSDLTGRGWAGAGRCRGGRAGGVLSAGEGPWAAPLLLMACGATGDRCLALLLRARGAAAARLLGPGGRRGRRLWPIDLRPRRRRWRRLPSGPLRRRWRRPRGRLEGVGPVRRPAIWIRRSAGGIARRGVRVARPLERIVELERVVGDPEGVEVWPERVAQGPLRPEGVILLVERVERDVVVVVAGRAHRAPPRASVASRRSVVVVSSSAIGVTGGATLVGRAMVASAVSTSRASTSRKTIRRCWPLRRTSTAPPLVPAGSLKPCAQPNTVVGSRAVSPTEARQARSAGTGSTSVAAPEPAASAVVAAPSVPSASVALAPCTWAMARAGSLAPRGLLNSASTPCTRTSAGPVLTPRTSAGGSPWTIHALGCVTGPWNRPAWSVGRVRSSCCLATRSTRRSASGPGRMAT